jgi:hypothetical protein
VTTPNIDGKRRVGRRTVRERLEAARAEALREKFRAGGALLDLKCAADELQITMIELDRAIWKTGPKV